MEEEKEEEEEEEEEEKEEEEALQYVIICQVSAVSGVWQPSSVSVRWKSSLMRTTNAYLFV